MAKSSFGSKASGATAMAWARRPAASSQSGRSRPRASAHGHPAAQRVVDRRRPRQQRIPPRSPVGVHRPQHRPVVALPPQHEGEGTVDHRPHPLQHRGVARHPEVVPAPGGHVGADVRVETRVLHPGAGEVVVEPRTVGQLAVGQPLIRPQRFLVETPDGQAHGRLGVIPRIAVPALGPRDHPVVALDVGDRGGRLLHLRRRQHAGHLGQRRHHGAMVHQRLVDLTGGRRHQTLRGGHAGFSR